MCIDICIDMCIDMCIYMRMDERIDLCSPHAAHTMMWAHTIMLHEARMHTSAMRAHLCRHVKIVARSNACTHARTRTHCEASWQAMVLR